VPQRLCEASGVTRMPCASLGPGWKRPSSTCRLLRLLHPVASGCESLVAWMRHPTACQAETKAQLQVQVARFACMCAGAPAVPDLECVCHLCVLLEAGVCMVVVAADQQQAVPRANQPARQEYT
jgi:hypothetical protein